jgi:hypothetical protein
MKNRNRTENIDFEFAHGVAKDWAFDVSEAFRSSLDIAYMRRADKVANAALKAELGRSLEAHEKTWRQVWTQGDPPAYAFAEGDVFYDPPGVRAMAWRDALKVLCRTVEVLSAKPDPGALAPEISDDDEASSDGAEEAPNEEPSGGSGWVRYRIRYYEAGTVTRQDTGNLRQCEFAAFLRTGTVPSTRTSSVQDESHDPNTSASVIPTR